MNAETHKSAYKLRTVGSGLLLFGLTASVSLLQAGHNPPPPPTSITAIWANEGGDKVSQEELRATNHTENLTGKVINQVWNGKGIILSGARNEVLSFNLVLEAGGQAAPAVAVAFDTLTGPHEATIHSVSATGNGVFNWVNRPIELFYVRYLQIKGLSYFGYNKWDERQIPARFRRPWTGSGVGSGLWTDRPDHDRFYPDILVPLELVPSFTIGAQHNQSVWADIYIPKTAPSGVYAGQVLVKENGAQTHAVPVSLTVRNFSLPDEPSAKTMTPVSYTDIMWRYITGYGGYVNSLSAEGQRIVSITDKYFQLFHRHKLSLIGENDCPVLDQPCATSLPRLDGSLFTASKGYDGPGTNTPNRVFSIGTYGSWNWKAQGQSGMWSHTDSWVTWFQQNLPGTDYFIYLADEPQPADYAQVNTWAQWINGNPGPGRTLPSMVTHYPVLAQTDMPDVDLPTYKASLGACPNNANTCANSIVNQSAADFYRLTPGRKLWAYNYGGPATGSSDTEDDGVAMRQLPWAQYKKQIDRWFYWYANIETPVDLFSQAVTWGSIQFTDPIIGQTGNDGTTNGNGVLVYPGTNLYNPANSYGVDGPFASVRLKEWRRGVQDADYLTLAARYDPNRVNSIVNTLVPMVLWEYPAQTPSYYTGGGVSWSSDPDKWEAARSALAQVISNHCSTSGATNEPNSPCR